MTRALAPVAGRSWFDDLWPAPSAGSVRLSSPEPGISACGPAGAGVPGPRAGLDGRRSPGGCKCCSKRSKSAFVRAAGGRDACSEARSPERAAVRFIGPMSEGRGASERCARPVPVRRLLAVPLPSRPEAFAPCDPGEGCCRSRRSVVAPALAGAGERARDRGSVVRSLAAARSIATLDRGLSRCSTRCAGRRPAGGRAASPCSPAGSCIGSGLR